MTEQLIPERDAAELYALFLGDERSRQAYVVCNASEANGDRAWFSMLDDEWAERRSALETWLYQDDSMSLSEVNQARLPY